MTTTNLNMKIVATLDRRPDREGLYSVLIFLRFPGNIRRQIATGVKVRKKDWDSKANQCRSDADAVVVDKILETVKAWRRGLLVNGRQVTSDMFDDWLHVKEQGDTFNAFYDDMLKQQYSLNEVSIRDQRQTLNLLNAYKHDIGFRELNKKTVMGFNEYLAKQGFATNTIKKHHKNLKKYVNLAIDHGKLEVTLDRHPYRSFRVAGKESDRVHLSEHEIEMIRDADLTGRAVDVRRLFLFASMTGIRFNDTQESDIRWRDEGIEYTPGKTKRTTGLVRVPYDVMWMPEVVRDYYLKPVKITNPECNRVLKEIMVVSEVDKLLTFHVSRHTFLTMVAKKTGNLFKVMKYAGLKKTDTAMVYVNLGGV